MVSSGRKNITDDWAAARNKIFGLLMHSNLVKKSVWYYFVTQKIWTLTVARFWRIFSLLNRSGGLPVSLRGLRSGLSIRYGCDRISSSTRHPQISCEQLSYLLSLMYRTHRSRSLRNVSELNQLSCSEIQRIPKRQMSLLNNHCFYDIETGIRQTVHFNAIKDSKTISKQYLLIRKFLLDP